uniref:Uncharacterized protein n=1 Tax=Oryza brachyantha TaxID=4533 RepID=J3LRK5_ORYBR
MSFSFLLLYIITEKNLPVAAAFCIQDFVFARDEKQREAGRVVQVIPTDTNNYLYPSDALYMLVRGCLAVIINGKLRLLIKHIHNLG